MNTGEVSSSNFTTLYNASGLAVPNAGAGQITGNLNVGGNLTVQGSSLLVGEVTLQSTLCLPNYCFPLPDGSTDQVMTTDGNGNLTWVDVTAIPGADYQIEANTATGGANLTLFNTAGFTDSVKFAAGTNMSIVRTDANTITISTVADNIPDGTANGQLLVWENGAWTATANVINTDGTNRLVANYNAQNAGTNSAMFARKDFTTIPYTTGDGVGYAFQLDSNSQAINQLAQIHARWNPTAPEILLMTNTNNNTAGPFVNAAIFSPTLATLNGDLAVNGGDITTLPGGIANLYNNNAVDTINIGNSVVTEVNIGNTVGSRVQIKSPTIVGNNATQNVFNTVATTVNAFGASTATNIGAATGVTTLGNNLDVNGEVVRINANNTAADSYLYFKGSNEYLQWDNTNTRFELSDQLYISQDDIPALLQRRVTTATTSSGELRTSLRLQTRVTDVANNDTLITGPAIQFSRLSGVSDTTERLFAGLGSSWDGGTQTANIAFNWSNDNFSEPTPGYFPGSYTLLTLNSDWAQFQNNSIYVDYSTAGAGKVGINKTASATYNLDVNGTTNTSGQLSLPSMVSNTADPIFAYRNTATTNIGVRALSLLAQSSGTPTVGFGTTLEYQVETSATNTERAGYITVGSTDVTAGSEDFRMDFGLMRNGATYTNQASLFSDGRFNIAGPSMQLNGDAANVDVYQYYGRSGGYSAANIRWNATTNTFEWTEGALFPGVPTYHQFIDATLTAPFYNGQILSYLNGEWINDNRVLTTDANERNVFSYRPLSPVAGYNTALYLRKDYSNAAPGTTGAGTYTDGAGSALTFSVVSDTQAPPGGTAGQANAYASIAGIYSSTNPSFLFRTTLDNGTTNNTIAEISSTIIDADATKLTLAARSDVDTSGVLTTTSTSTQPLITSTRNVMKAVVYISQGADVHTVEALVLKTGASTAMLTTYGEMYNTTSLATFTADTSGGSIRLLVTPANATSMSFTSVITSLT